jgi:ABC-type transport system involved in cytochrome c biogenesis ATPase subunit
MPDIEEIISRYSSPSPTPSPMVSPTRTIFSDDANLINDADRNDMNFLHPNSSYSSRQESLQPNSKPIPRPLNIYSPKERTHSPLVGVNFSKEFRNPDANFKPRLSRRTTWADLPDEPEDPSKRPIAETLRRLTRRDTWQDADGPIGRAYELEKLPKDELALTPSRRNRPVADTIRRLSRRITVADPFDTVHPQWTFERTLRAAVERIGGDNGTELSPRICIRWKNVKVYGEDVGSRAQSDAASIFSDLYKSAQGLWRRKCEKEILHGIDGVLNEGEMLLVLGGPSSGCTTLLKTLAGQTEGYTKRKGAIRCSGISLSKVMERFRGSVVYNGAVENHFPELTVGQTLEFAAKTKTPHRRIDGISRAAYAARMKDIVGTAFGLRHTFNTRVGNDFIRGVSGGERRRVTIAEMVSIEIFSSTHQYTNTS